jgi:hypothetical protein
MSKAKAEVKVILTVDLLDTKDINDCLEVVDHVNKMLQLLNLKNNPRITKVNLLDLTITKNEDYNI